MKRVNNADINFVINPSCVNLTNFTIKFYTTNEKYFYIEKNQDDVTTRERQSGVGGVDYIVKLDWSQLITIGKGVMNYKIINNYEDDDRADAEYNTSIERTSDYYIDSNVTVSEEEAESYAQVVAELGDRIDAEIVRSESADTEQSLALNTEIETRQNQVDIILNLIQDISGDTDMTNYYTKSETSGATEISDALSDKLDVSAYTQTDLTNYYTKSETSGASEIANALNDKADKSNTYTKSQVDTAIANVDVSDQLQDYLLISAYTDDSETIAAALNDLNDRKLDSSAYTPTDLTNYYTKSQTSGASEISSALSSKLDSTAYTPTDLTDYYTKSETSGASEISTALDGKANKTAAFGGYSYGSTNNQPYIQYKNVNNGNIGNEIYYPKINGKDTLTSNSTWAQNNLNFSLVETSAITSSITSASTDSQIPTAKAVYDSLGGGGGKAIEAGRGISITTGETADTISFNLPISAGTGANSIVMGEKATANGAWSFANGNGNILYETSAAGERAIAIGYVCEANGNTSIANGQYCTANGIYSHAIGSFVDALNDYETSIGKTNVSNKANDTFGNSGNTLFSIGNGDTQSKRHNAFEIRQNGDIYIADTNDTSTTNYYEKPMIKLQDKFSSLDTTIGNINTILESI